MANVYSRAMLPTTGSMVDTIKYLKECTNVSFKNSTVRSLKFDEDSTFAIVVSTACKLSQHLSNGTEMTNGLSRTVRTTTSALLSILRDNDEYTAVATLLESNPQLFPIIFLNAKIDLVGIDFAAGDIIDNPFSSSEGNNVLKTDYIKYYIYNVTLNCPLLDKVIDKYNATVLDSIVV
jgi:hypothetical protein